MLHQHKSGSYAGQKHQELIDILLQCATACEYCATACLAEEDVTPMADCIKNDRDCSEICFALARLLMRDSPVATGLLSVCEEACRMCAAACGKHEHEHCRQCAAACTRCMEACRKHAGSEN